jgi:MFS transporter, SP family, galactose:H+ symporter
MAGFSNDDEAIYWSMAIAFTNMSMSVVAIVLIDRVGRRPLLLVSLAGSGLALVLLAFAFAFNMSYLALAALVLYLVFFAPGMGPAPWAINAEIYPLFMRSTGTSIATCANWSANFVVSLTFIGLTNLVTQTGTFALYAAICFVALVCVFLFVPETKGRSLESIKQVFQTSIFVYNLPDTPPEDSTLVLA